MYHDAVLDEEKEEQLLNVEKEADHDSDGLVENKSSGRVEGMDRSHGLGVEEHHTLLEGG